jgi:DNA-binding NarL/FixJ family response regulator
MGYVPSQGSIVSMSIEPPSNVTTISGIFVGNFVNFSDTLLRLVKSELPFVNFRRAATTYDIMFATDELAKSVQIIIIDETMWHDLASTIPQLRGKFRNANFALAYRKVDSARRLIVANRENPDIGDLGYLPMNIQLDCWLSALRLLVGGEHFMPNELFAHSPVNPPGNPPVPHVTIEKAAHEEAPNVEITYEPDEAYESPGNAGLTVRELQVLKAVAEGKQNKIIAEELKISQHTVKLHIRHMMSKLGINNRTEAAIWYLGRNAQIEEVDR